jgi:hypothetical protein
MAPATIDLTQRPAPVRLWLSNRTGFAVTLTLAPDSPLDEWPEGTSVVMHVTSPDGKQGWHWPAVMGPRTVTFSRTLAETAPVPAGSLIEVELIMPGSQPVEWFQGGVVR